VFDGVLLNFERGDGGFIVMTFSASQFLDLTSSRGGGTACGGGATSASGINATQSSFASKPSLTAGQVVRPSDLVLLTPLLETAQSETDASIGGGSASAGDGSSGGSGGGDCEGGSDDQESARSQAGRGWTEVLGVVMEEEEVLESLFAGNGQRRNHHHQAASSVSSSAVPSRHHASTTTTTAARRDSKVKVRVYPGVHRPALLNALHSACNNSDDREGGSGMGDDNHHPLQWRVVGDLLPRNLSLHLSIDLGTITIDLALNYSSLDAVFLPYYFHFPL
jgi:hypothetical protein